jgi:hypothetical protein
VPHSPVVSNDLPIRAKKCVAHAAHFAYFCTFVQVLLLSFFSKQLAASPCCKKARILDKIGAV